MVMSPFRCMLCGETYLGFVKADRCPFCGASETQLVPAALWVDYGAVPMSPESQNLCREALALELSNAAFYKASSKAAQTQISDSIFKRLWKQELEHAEIFTKMLGEELPALLEEDSPEDDSDKFREAHSRETRAIKFYLAAANIATEKRVQDVFRGLSEVEIEHLKVSNVYR
jgi:rubrerythrin